MNTARRRATRAALLVSALLAGCDDSADEPQASGGQPGWRVTRQDLGRIAVTNTTTGRVSFTVPDGTVSFTLVAGLPSDVQAVVPVTVTGPDGVLYDYDQPDNARFRTLGLSYAPYAALYPNTPRLALQAGDTFAFDLAATAPTTLQVDVLFKQGRGELTHGSLPLVFFFPAGATLDAARARTDTTLQQSIASIQSLYASIGLTLTIDDRSYVDLPGASGLATIDERAQLQALFALANTSPVVGLSYFVVDRFTFSSGLLGLAGGLPGSPGLEGVDRAGVAIPYAQFGGDAAALAQVMAHEAGHYLGLFHTTESDGQTHDPLDDTPACPASLDTNGDGRVDSTECQAHGADNIMFWMADSTRPRTFSADQQHVLLRHPLVTH